MPRTRKRIGLQTARLEYGYGVKIWQGAVACAEKMDADLIVFPGRNLEAPHGFDYQYNRIFSLMTKDNLDALILITTLVCNYIDDDAISEFCSRFKDIPLVSIGMKIPAVPSIIVDNRDGIRRMVRHLATSHGARRIAFIRGPANNEEAKERYAAYLEELEEQGIPFDGDLVTDGDFTAQSARPALEALFKKNAVTPDAFVFASDEMAINGMQFLHELGIPVPSGAAVTGFDDIVEASTQTTPITTVRQPLWAMGYQAIETAIGLLENKEAPALTILPTELVIRSSCGCLIRCVEDVKGIERGIRGAEAPGQGVQDCLALSVGALRGLNSDYVVTIEERGTRMREVIGAMLGLCGGGKPGSAEDEDRFISRFGDMLKEELSEGSDPGEWQYIIPAIRAAIERVRGPAADVRRMDSISRLLSILSAEMSSIRMKAAHYVSSNENTVLQDVQFNLSSIVHIEDLETALRNQLPRLGINTFLLSKYEHEWRHDARTPWNIPDRSRFIAGMLDGSRLRPEAGDRETFPSGLLSPSDIMTDDKRRTYAVYPLFFREIHYGTIMYEMTHLNGYVYESLTTQIAGILKAITLYGAKEKAEERLRQAMAELESFNKELSDLTLTDELTGLYNRRGFLKLARQQLSISKQMGKNSLLIYADIDGLKGINDSFGHEEGDIAIKTVAEILRKTFRAMDIEARLGGDEFTVFASNADKSHIQLLEARLTELINSSNAAAHKSYELSLSVGWVICEPGEPKPLEDYMREADAELYAKKKSRKSPDA
jgi:diguanylate cyclase (GGDEF)-like protein